MSWILKLLVDNQLTIDVSFNIFLLTYNSESVHYLDSQTTESWQNLPNLRNMWLIDLHLLILIANMIPLNRIPINSQTGSHCNCIRGQIILGAFILYDDDHHQGLVPTMLESATYSVSPFWSSFYIK